MVGKVALSAVLAVAVTAGTAHGTTEGKAKYRKVRGIGPRVVAFRHMGRTEDSCIVARLVEFGNGRAVYRCYNADEVAG